MRHILERQRLMKLYILIAVMAAVVCAASVAVADDPYAPPWRGTTGSTFQEWRFSTNSNPAAPETWSNPFGVPSAAINWAPPFGGTGWYNIMPGVYGTAQGWWDIAIGSIVLSIINHPNLGVNTSKDIQVQVIYWDDISAAPGVLVTPAATPPRSWFVSKTTTLVEHVVVNGHVMGDWNRDLWILHVDPNLNSETITVWGDPSMGSQIDKIVVDTRYAAVIDSAAQVRTLPVDTVVELSGPVVTRSFNTFFYMENRNRAAGIRINCAVGQTPAAEGTAPTVRGVIRIVDGERAIDEATVVPGGTGSVLAFGMNCRAVRTGLIPQALFVKLWGRAHVTPTSFTLNDGSPEAVSVQLYGVAPPADADGHYFAVTGVLGANLGGPVLRVGLSDTITKMD